MSLFLKKRSKALCDELADYKISSQNPTKGVLFARELGLRINNRPAKHLTTIGGFILYLSHHNRDSWSSNTMQIRIRLVFSSNALASTRYGKVSTGEDKLKRITVDAAAKRISKKIPGQISMPHLRLLTVSKLLPRPLTKQFTSSSVVDPS